MKLSKSFFLEKTQGLILQLAITVMLSLTAFGTYGQQFENLRFDISKVPFSRYGSYMSLSTADRDSSHKAAMHLYELTGKKAFSYNGVLKIEPAHDGKVIPVTYESGPLQVKGKTAEGDLTFYFESAEILHILSDGPGVVMTGDLNVNNTLSIPGYPQSWKIRDNSFVITVKSGEGGFQEKSSGDGFIIKPIGGKLDIVIEQYKSDWLPRSYQETYLQSQHDLRKELQDWESKIPTVPPPFHDAANLAAYINWSCIVKPDGNIKRYGMVMSKNWMYNIWSWDNCFNAISLSYRQPRLSWDQLMLIFDQQDTSGALPDYVNAHHMVWEFRKPPIHGWTLAKLMDQYSLNKDQLSEIYQKLSAWTNYWFIYRDGNHNGLPEYYHGNDSGWDNSTAFDMGFPVEGPDLAALLVTQMDVLAKVAFKLGKLKESEEWKTKADKTLKNMIDAFWNGQKFVSKNPVSGQINGKSQSLMSYIPIILGERLPKRITDKMIADLKNPDFLITLYGLATESPKSSLYVPDGYWRGPTWAPTTLMVIDGLYSLNQRSFAKDLAMRFCNTCKKSGFAENFNSLTGEPLRDPAYTWTSSVFLILAHNYLGLSDAKSNN